VHELEKREIERQLFLGDAAMRSQPRTQQRPKALYRIDVDFMKAVAVLVARIRAQLLAYCERDTLGHGRGAQGADAPDGQEARLESIMANKDKSAATWSDVKAKLGDFDRAGLLGLVHDLYAASKDNQNFLHTRFGLGCDVLKPYKTIIERWLWPDVYKNQQYSVSKAKKPITDYKKASSLLEVWPS
jgi:hypothetical protein